jgi:hypothetical protein
MICVENSRSTGRRKSTADLLVPVAGSPLFQRVCEQFAPHLNAVQASLALDAILREHGTNPCDAKFGHFLKIADEKLTDILPSSCSESDTWAVYERLCKLLDETARPFFPGR